MNELIQQGWIPFFVREADRGNKTPDTVVALYLPMEEEMEWVAVGGI